MADVTTTKMSSKGQVVIPEEIRRRLGLKPGSRFVVVAAEGTVILKTVSVPSMSEFDALISEAKKQARRAGMKQKRLAQLEVTSDQPPRATTAEPFHQLNRTESTSPLTTYTI